MVRIDRLRLSSLSKRVQGLSHRVQGLLLRFVLALIEKGNSCILTFDDLVKVPGLLTTPLLGVGVLWAAV